MARDGLFFKSAARLNKHQAPAMALLAQGLWTSFLTLPRTIIHDPTTGAVTYGNVYTQLLEYIISADLMFYILMVGAVIVLRRKAATMARPYRTWGYPIVPLIYISIAGILIIDLIYLAPSTSGIGFLLVLAGVPIYLMWRKRA
jgi:APA family basic amino acid/polyamine antiporter